MPWKLINGHTELRSSGSTVWTYYMEQWEPPGGIACRASAISCSVPLSTLGKWTCRISDRAAVARDPVFFCFCDKGLKTPHQLRPAPIIAARLHMWAWERGPFVSRCANGCLEWIIKDEHALCSCGLFGYFLSFVRIANPQCQVHAGWKWNTSEAVS